MDAEQLHETFAIHEGDAMRTTLVGHFALYFDDFEAARPALIQAWGLLTAAMGSNLRHYSTAAMNRARKVDPALGRLFSTWFEEPYTEPEDGGEYGVWAHSDDNPEWPGQWGLHAYVQPWDLEYEAAFIAFNMPLAQVADGTFVATAKRLVEIMPTLSAYGGLAVARNPGYPRQDAALGAHCLRYRGLIFDEPDAPRIPAQEGVVTPAWVTVLSEKWTKRCELGLETLTEHGIIVDTIGDTTWLQVGPQPELGDNNRDELMPAYHALREFLDPVLTKSVEHMGYSGFDEANLERWMQRFDSP